jgi:hypothetical protein
LFERGRLICDMVRNHTPGKIFVAGAVGINCFYIKKSSAVIIAPKGYQL